MVRGAGAEADADADAGGAGTVCADASDTPDRDNMTDITA
jgi:hypothetical protein